MQRILVYTDGSCLGNPGPGGWAAVILARGNGGMGEYEEHPICGRELNTTNNRMELRAAIEALVAIEGNPEWTDAQITVNADSKYVKNGITEWIKTWKKTGWKSSSGGAVKNQDLWELLDQVTSRHTVEWQWVQGHGGEKYNEMCDKLAKERAADSSEDLV
jgi:ribonuclease HI